MAMKQIILPLFACALIASSAAAQSDRGRLTGTIFDSTGAVVPNARVSATNRSTGAARQAAADEKGNYRIDDLLPAPYELAAVAAGFAQDVVTDVTMAGGQEATVHIRVQPEGVFDSVAEN